MRRQFQRYIKPDYFKQKSELTPVYIRYDYNRTKRTFINTGHRIDPDLYWDFKKHTIKRSCPDFEKVSQDIEDIENKISNILQYARNNRIDPTPEYLVDRLQDIKGLFVENNKQTAFFQSLDRFINDRESNGSVCEHVVRDYRSLRKHLVNFEKYWKRPISFVSLDIEFYEKFVYYLTYVVEKPDKQIGLKMNTIGKQIKNLKVFYNDRRQKDNLPVIDLSDFKKKNEMVDHVYLTEAEILHIWNFDLSENPDLIESRDLLVFGCYTGLRYSDIYSLKPYHFKKVVVGGDIQTAIQKTQRKVHEKVDIALIYLAKIVAEKYGYALPKIPMNEFNEKLKKIGEKVELDELVSLTHKKGNEVKEDVYKKYQLLSSHVCRRSFATNMYLRGIEPDIIMTNTGHSSLKTLFSYIKVTKREKAFKLYDYFTVTETKEKVLVK
ncbi:tyrosine-type recombinase/integrase [Sediminibacterium sp.]|uniref:tyrosine-type recombinase/integrase n=1 Tax=Sediminibacterium sp. TaxID=1917865 RepID=UPI0025F7FAE1|nr:tyrosine-type recombinase/integrase [Sediminibacterium sp.]MBW0178507.1 site-specific integrase [Sediminibacterium sp.]